jgi:hypothetical protein
MRTTTVVFKFNPEPSAEDLASRSAAYQAILSPVLSQFATLHDVSTDNLVSLTVDHETCLRTVVRSWPDSDIAAAWVYTSLQTKLWLTDDFPGMIISAQVNPE